MFIFGMICVFFKLTDLLVADTEVVVLRAVRGRDARLPCGQGKVFLDGPDSYVLWLKNDRDFMYRFPNEDTEKRALTRDRIYGTSCDSGVCYDDTSLLLKKISDSDGGHYRCRVHYQASPSVDYVIEVRLVDSPGYPRIYDGEGEPITKGFVGPLSLGFDLKLVCEVNDDQPDTMVYWRRNGVVIERAEAARPGILRAEISVTNATRDELDAHYECLAQNADVTEPLTASLVIKMYLAPLSVEIRLNNNYDFEAGQPRVVDCVVVGCVPPPSITWQLGESILRPSVHKELHDGNYTVSSLTLAPSLRNSKKPLICKAHNSHQPDAVYEDRVILNVGYRPECVSSREETIGAVEREVETVTCVVEGSPEPLQFSWTFADSRTLYTSVKKVPGHHNRYSSTLTWVPRKGDIGLLYCRATNAFGEQKKPCSYTVTPGGPPQPPECVLLRSYPEVLRVQCKKAWDGGRLQTVYLELLEENGTLLRNLSDPAGHFQLPTVQEDRNLTALIYAASSRGRSIATAMRLKAVRPSTSPVHPDRPKLDWAFWAEAGAGTVVVGISFALIAACLKAFKRRGHDSDLNPDLVPRSDGTFHREPDFAREERLLGTTNITVNQLAACQNVSTFKGGDTTISDMPTYSYMA